MLQDSTLPDIKQLEGIVKRAAREEILPGFGNHKFTYKEDGSVVTKADIAMQQRLNDEFRQIWPQYELIGEEMTELQQLDVINSGKSYWCIDPLDGTSNFAAGIEWFGIIICVLKDFRVKFHLNGFDIDEIKVSTSNLDELRSKLTPEEIKSLPSDDTTSMAMQAIKKEFGQVMNDKYGYDAGVFAYDNSDAGGISISKMPEEQPGIDDIAGNMEPFDDGMGGLGPEMEPPMEPGLEGGADLTEPMPLEPGPDAGGLPPAAPAAPAPAPAPAAPAPAPAPM